MRTLYIYCDGGFGNRLNGLASGLLMAHQFGLAPLVVWPTNNWCGAAYTDLFEAGAEVRDEELSTFITRRDALCFVMTEDHLQSGVPFCHPLNAGSAQVVKEFIDCHPGDVFYHSPLIPGWLDTSALFGTLASLPIRRHLWEQVHRFLRQHQLDDYIGVHIRKTDFGANSSDDEGLFRLLSSCPQKRFFVCSDDAAVEQRFATLPNVVCHGKQAYVERRVAGDWNTPTLDHSGRLYACNVERNALSVEAAVVDLLILAYSQILDSSNSTFRNSALLLKAALQLDPKSIVQRSLAP